MAPTSFIPIGRRRRNRPGGVPDAATVRRATTCVIVFLTRHVLFLWALCWFALALVILLRIAKGAREIAAARRTFARLTLALASTIAATLATEGTVRLAHYLRADRRPLDVQLRGARDRPTSSMQTLRLGEIVQPSRYPGIVYELKPDVHGRFMASRCSSLSGTSRLRVHASQEARHISDRGSRRLVAVRVGRTTRG